MENNQKEETKQIFTLKSYFSRDEVKSKFQEMLGKKAQGFITSVLQIAASSDKLSKADPISIYNSAAMAATLDLPLNNNLGFAYIVPYEISVNLGPNQWEKRAVAQFQMGYKGFIQLAQRSGEFQTMNATDVREGEIKHRDRLTGFIEFQWIQDDAERQAKPIIGYASYFKLLNGFEKIWYMSLPQVQAHGARYSKSYNKDSGLWKKDFDSMATKTVTKLLLSKFAPLSIESIHKAIAVDQAVLNNEEGTDVSYPDGNSITEAEELSKEEERAIVLIKEATTLKDLQEYLGAAMEFKLMDLWEKKKEELSK